MLFELLGVKGTEIDAVEESQANKDRMELGLEDAWITMPSEKLQFVGFNAMCRVVLVPQMTVRAQGKQILNVIVRRVFVNMMNLRPIASTDGATMVVFTE